MAILKTFNSHPHQAFCLAIRHFVVILMASYGCALGTTLYRRSIFEVENQILQTIVICTYRVFDFWQTQIKKNGARWSGGVFSRQITPRLLWSPYNLKTIEQYSTLFHKIFDNHLNILPVLKILLNYGVDIFLPTHTFVQKQWKFQYHR